MKLATICLGKVGANMATRLLQGGHRVIAFALDHAAVKAAGEKGVEGITGMAAVADRRTALRAVWVMAPAGGPTKQIVTQLTDIFSPDDIMIDGGKSSYKDSPRRAATREDKGFHFVDVGTSGGV